MGYVACLGQIPEETAHVLQNIVSANGLNAFLSILCNCNLYCIGCITYSAKDRHNVCLLIFLSILLRIFP